MKAVRFLAVLASVACVSVAARAQDPDIVITAERTRAFVDAISLASGTSDGMARWDDRVCVGAVGLAPDQAQALVDRISQRARAVGLRPGEPGCRANVMVIYAPDSDAISRQIVDQRRDLLGFYNEDGRATAGRAAMDAFAATPRPIRWWHISDTGVGSLRPSTGTSRQNASTSAAIAAATSNQMGGQSSASDVEGMDAVRSNGSRARQEVRNDLNYALVVVDARRVAGVPASAWMDYVAMVSLAQLDPDSQTSDYPTLLNLFTGPSGALAGMTPWDIAYLDGLYRARRDNANRQAGDIARRIADSR